MTINASSTKQDPCALDRHQEDSLNAVVSLTKELNAAIASAVEAGLTIEVTRDSRHHTTQRSWGDQLGLAIQKAN